jgi:eukaryotic-like serine/threonine-protein kinase
VATFDIRLFQDSILPGNYEPAGPVVVGGTASVFRATDTRNGQPVAIKVFHRSDIGLLKRETEILRQVAQPGVPRLFTVSDRAPCFIAMEWMEGRSLRDYMDTGELSLERSVGLARRLCGLVAEVHGRGVAHLDLKPEHVLIDSDDRPSLIDFGAARQLKGIASLFGRSGRTGTPDYAAPEQIKGRTGDFRSDVYSLGLILYEMVTGELPFSGVALDVAVNLRLVRDPVLAREINPEISFELQDLLRRAIDRDPARRPADARELCSLIDELPEVLTTQLVASLD